MTRMNAELPKYTRWEHERRSLVRKESSSLFLGRPHLVIHDKYLEFGRLRLRSMTSVPGGEAKYKLCKKFSSASPFSAPIVNIYLSHEEYQSLSVLKGRDLIKHRYHHVFGGYVFGVDFFQGELQGLSLCEVECESEAELLKVKWPEFADHDVTEDCFFTGGNLSRTSAESLSQKLEALYSSAMGAE